jgi:putative molybdopterin biosynthesis protein
METSATDSKLGFSNRNPFKRQVYLHMKSLEEARELFFARFGPDHRTGVESVRAGEASGRVTAEPVFAKRSAPSYHAAAMDGIAVRAETTYGTTERHPRILQIDKDAVWTNTGQALPKGYDSVIMVEKIHEIDETHVEIREPAYPWQHIRKVGEDIVATQLLMPQNHEIQPVDIGALISGGIFSLKVWERPRVAIIPTGSELIHYMDIPENGSLGEEQIIEYNSLVLAALVRRSGAIPKVYPIVPDREDDIRDALREAVDSNAHVVILNAGSSAGSKDYTVHIMSDLGEVLVHGVSIMPGKPTILGAVGDKPVVGNPGYAVSSVLSFDQFVKPILYAFQGRNCPDPETVMVEPTRDLPSKLGIEEFIRVNIGKVGDRYVATPLPRAAGSITTLTRAEGIVRVAAHSEGISQKETVAAELLVGEEDLLRTIVVIGSHDISIDVLADEIRGRGRGYRISSGNVGSLGGLIALKKGVCHLCGSHLMDTETGQYNLSYVVRYLKGLPVCIFNLVLREQGLIVKKGNPKGIQALEDLSRGDVVFVNRQAGSGTRVLLDYKLAKLGVEPESVKGYDHEEFTHMAVAVDVLSGAADCGMGILAAAKALDLEFLPIEQEQYDLIVPTELVAQPYIQAVLDTIRSKAFRTRVKDLGGYDPENSGELWMEVPG